MERGPHGESILVAHRPQSCTRRPPAVASPGQSRGSLWLSGPRSAQLPDGCPWEVTLLLGSAEPLSFGNWAQALRTSTCCPGVTLPCHPALSPAALRFPLWRGAKPADSSRACSPGSRGDTARPRVGHTAACTCFW